MKILLIFLLLLLSGCSVQKKNADTAISLEEIHYKIFEKASIVEKEITIGESETRILDTGKNRVSNIRLACNSINGSRIPPKGEFSFNDLTGKKTKARGYKNAPVIVEGEKSDGIGGGVCQVSTTIYMAALNANLEITEHHNHSERVAYAPGKNDATVVFGYKDLKFKNNTANDICIYVWEKDKKVFAKIVQSNCFFLYSRGDLPNFSLKRLEK